MKSENKSFISISDTSIETIECSSVSNMCACMCVCLWLSCMCRSSSKSLLLALYLVIFFSNFVDWINGCLLCFALCTRRKRDRHSLCMACVRAERKFQFECTFIFIYLFITNFDFSLCFDRESLSVCACDCVNRVSLMNEPLLAIVWHCTEYSIQI